MQQKLSHFTLVVNDYDEAIAFYTQKLKFTLLEDTPLSATKRWVIVRPKGAPGSALLLAKAATPEQKSSIGNQTGGRVFLFLHTDNFARDYQNLIDQHIRIVRTPSVEAYGTVAVFEDLYGNLWDLIEPKKATPYFYSTAILTIKDPEKIDRAITELQKLREQTLQESGVIFYDIRQGKDDPTTIIIWECFKDEQSFGEHLNSHHLREFLQLDLVKLESSYLSEDIA